MKILVFLFSYSFLFLTHIEANNAQFNTDSILIRTENKQYIFNVEIATSKKERSIGLMHRKNLKQNQGMLFIYPSNQIIKMWMKNTLIPLDMIFIKENGQIENIIKMTKPNDLTPIGPEVELKAVLEINGGLTTYLKIKKGHFIIHPIFTGK